MKPRALANHVGLTGVIASVAYGEARGALRCLYGMRRLRKIPEKAGLLRLAGKPRTGESFLTEGPYLSNVVEQHLHRTHDSESKVRSY
jgi:hypothetical protein